MAISYLREIRYFLNSLRYSIDSALSRPGPKREQQFIDALLKVEEARIRFNTSVQRQERFAQGEWNSIQAELLGSLEIVLMVAEADDKLGGAAFRFLAPRSEASFIAALGKKKITIVDALREFRAQLRDYTPDTLLPQESLSFDSLRRIVPGQQVAPVQFKVVNGKLSIAQAIPRAAEEDRKNIASAFEHIRGSGEKLIESLKSSNCDRRLVESVEELQSQVIKNTDVVRIGLTNIACGIMCSQFQNELADAIVGMLNAYSRSVSLYVAQFPEWEQFALKAAQIDLDQDDIADVDAAAEKVVEAISRNPEIADPEVPKTIAFIRQLLSMPGSTSKRAAFAVIRTIENLVSSILLYAVELAAQTAKKTIDGLSGVGAKVIIVLLGIALVGAEGIGSAAVQAGSPWVKQATEIVQRQIEKIGQ